MPHDDAVPPLPPSALPLPPELEFMEALRVPFILLDDTLRVTYVNASGREHMRVFGYDPSLLLGMQVWVMFPSAKGTHVETALRSAWTESGPIHLEYFHPDTAQYVELDIARQGDALGLFWRNLAHDHTLVLQQAEFEADLLSARRQLEEFVAGAPVAIIIADNDLRVLSWNPAAERMFHWTAAEALGQLLPTIPDDERSRLDEMRHKVRGGQSISAASARRQRKDGALLDVQISSSPLRDASSTIVGVIGMITDVTEHRKLEAQLRMAQKMEAVGLLAGGVAHDFNNLLTAIKGFASLLQLTVANDAQAEEFLEEINKAADRAAALTAQLLAFSRRQLLRPEPLDLNARVRDLERMLRLLLREDGELVLELDPSLGDVLVDPGQVEQVILNLVVNARDAVRGQRGARVVIATSQAELRDEFTLWGVSSAPGPYIRLDVTDNGSGMDAATLSRIFDPFFTTKEPGQGTGLGLATVYGIVKQSGGYIWATSQPHAGATFTVYLPQARSAARTSGSAVVQPGRANEVVLLVEDELAVRRVVKRTLELKGYRVLEAANGDEAVALAERHEVHLLVSDVMMPGMLGPEVADAVRRLRPGIPVLFMSGHADEISRRGLVDPDTPFLAKPFSPGQLQEKVAEVLAGTTRS